MTDRFIGTYDFKELRTVGWTCTCKHPKESHWAVKGTHHNKANRAGYRCGCGCFCYSFIQMISGTIDDISFSFTELT